MVKKSKKFIAQGEPVKIENIVRYRFGSHFVKSVGDLPIVHRTDYHNDGSESDYFYLELTQQQFTDLTGISQKDTE